MPKTLILFPPQWSPLSPHLAPASIVGTVRSSGYTCHVRDLNIEFYTQVLTSDYIKNVLVELFNDEITLQEEISHEYDPKKSENDYDSDFQIKVKKLLQIKDVRENHLKETKNVIGLLEEAVATFKNKENFYNFDLLTKSMTIVDDALYLISLCDYPQEYDMHNFNIPSVKFTYEGILSYCNKDNMFKKFYDEVLPLIVEQNYDCIALSIGSSTQLLAGLTLSRMLMQKTNVKICIGGNYISRILDALKMNPKFFKDFAHFVTLEEGERAMVELLENIDKKRSIADVSSLVYLDKNNKVVVNEKKPPIKLSEITPPDLEGFPLKKYFLPEIVMPIQASRGCYWKRCTFCDHDFGQTYNVKDISKLIEEIKYFQNKFSISHFEFVDEAINPNFLENFSKRIIEEDLKINWYCNLRLESALTYEIFEIAYKAGLKMVLWGYESGSKRIMELINKGVDIDKRIEVLENASKAGIFNFAYLFFGFPTETKKEACETIDAICQNTDKIHAFGKSLFTLGKHAIINSNPEKYSIKKLPETEEFLSNAKYEILVGLNTTELIELNEDFVKKAIKCYPSKAWMYIRYRESLFLYICKYGADFVKTLKM